MYENGKMRHVETMPGTGGGGIKGNDGGVNSAMIYCKNIRSIARYPYYNYNNNFLKRGGRKRNE
jgi:hypothetical protein